MANQSIELHPDDIHEMPPDFHPSGKVTAFDEETGLPIVRRERNGGEDERPDRRTNERSDYREQPARATAEQPRSETSETPAQKVAGREVLHASDNREELVSQAKAHSKQFEDGLKSSTRGISGAHFDAVRDEKNPKRLDEKINDEQQPVETIPDLLAGRIGVDSHDAHEKTADALRNHFDVIRDEDEFKNGDPDFHYRVHKMQVKVTPQLSGEVHIVPKEVLDVNNKEHQAYKDARDAETDGDDDDEEQAKAKARKINDAAMEKFEARQNGSSRSSVVDRSSKDAVAGNTPKYEHGSTQANLPAGSDAHSAIRKLQSNIADADLAGDGKDIDDPHVTVRYGLDGSEDKVRSYLQSQRPFDAKLGKTASFAPTKNSKGAAIIIAPVQSDDLNRMNGEIAQHGEFAKSDFKDYKPHVTIAYVKPEAASKYEGLSDVDGKTFPVKTVSISDRDGKKTEVQLNGKADDSRSSNRDAAKPASRFNKSKQDLPAGSDIRTVPAQSDRAIIRRDQRDVPQTDSSRSQAVPIKKGQTVLVGDSHGIVRGGNPNFQSGGRWSVETKDGTKTMKGSQLQPVERAKVKDGSHWTGFDFDKTLAAHNDNAKQYDPWETGKPLSGPGTAFEKAKQLVEQGKDARIFSARVADDPKGIARAALEAWSHRNFGKALPVTHEKDYLMDELYDDRARQVEPNKGTVV